MTEIGPITIIKHNYYIPVIASLKNAYHNSKVQFFIELYSLPVADCDVEMSKVSLTADSLRDQ